MKGGLEAYVSLHRGLLCRALPCREVFHPATSHRLVDLTAAARRRDAHELEAHALVWVPTIFGEGRTKHEIKKMYFRMGAQHVRNGEAKA